MTASNTHAGQKRATSSVFLRIVALIAVTSLFIGGMLIWIFEGHDFAVAERTIRHLQKQVTTSSARVLGGHVVFQNEAEFTAELDYFVEASGTEFSGVTLYDAKGTVLASEGTIAPEQAERLAALVRSAQDSGRPAISETGFLAAIPIVYGRSGAVVGVLGSAWTNDVFMQTNLSETLPLLAFTGVFFIALLAVATWLLKRWVGRPLEEVSRAVEVVADGDLQSPVPALDRRDEIGLIARSLDALRARLSLAKEAEAAQEDDLIQQAIAFDEVARGLTALASGDLTYTIEGNFTGDRDRLRQDFNKTVQTLADLLRSVIDSAAEISARAEGISAGTDELSQRTETQAATLEETAASLDEMTSSVRTAASNAAQVETVTADARSSAVESGQVVRDAMSAMSAIKKSSDGINQIIGVIDDIAFQTNLLALNAGVEAARAGEAGRGFAVVASEVRGLAQRSSEAAMEIKQLISTSAEHVDTGVGLVDRAGDALTDIVDRVNNIAGLITDIATAMKEQAAGLDEINTGMIELDKVTQHNAAMVEETTAASTMMKQDSSSLQAQVARFRLAQAAPAGPSKPMPATQPHPAPSAKEIVADEAFKTAATGGFDEDLADAEFEMPKPYKPAPRAASAGGGAAEGGHWDDF
jgi:methyl-accepting chemotaxis protein